MGVGHHVLGGGKRVHVIVVLTPTPTHVIPAMRGDGAAVLGLVAKGRMVRLLKHVATMTRLFVGMSTSLPETTQVVVL